jgi:hypothetical protein
LLAVCVALIAFGGGILQNEVRATSPSQFWIVLSVVLIALGVIALVALVVEHLRPPPSAEPAQLDAVTVAAKLDESDDLSIKLRPEYPQSRLFEVGIRNPNDSDMHGVHANILMTEGIRVGKCTAGGTMTEEGWWSERPTPEAIGDEDEHDSWKDYWGPGGEGAAMTLPAGSSVLYFKLTISKPGKYRFRVKIWGGDLPAPITQDAFLVVGAAEALREGRDAISEVIHWGEQLIQTSPTVFGGDSASNQYFAWLLSAGKTIPDSHFALLHRHPPSSTSGDLRNALIRGVADLYDIRARLATEEYSPPLDELLGALYERGDEALTGCRTVPDGSVDEKAMWQLIGGTPEAQRQREEEAREWDRDISDLLSKSCAACYPAWRQAGEPPSQPVHGDQSQTNPAGLAAFYGKKLSVLAEIIGRTNR